ncbi:MAG TPA: SpoIIE family protein phosphatase [Thermoanaerobaculia bacterium]|jgi:serine phosphatase RsbU (regulator of sigma subunit)
MKIRSQLLLACFVLSVLPLTSIVFYSYRSSKRALEGAYHREAKRLTSQMDRRLTAIRADLDERLAGLSAIPVAGMKPTAAGQHSAMVDNVLMAMGDIAPLVDALEFVPTPARAPVVASKHAAHPAPQPPQPPDFNPDLSEPIVIDLPPVKYPKFAMPPDFNKRVAEITKLSIALGNQNLSREERDRLKAQLKEKQQQLDTDMEGSRETFHQQMEVAQEQRKERERILEARRDAESQKREAQRAERRVVRVRHLTDEQKQLLKTKAKQAALLFGQNFKVPVHSGGEVVGQIRAQLSTDEVIKRVLGAPNEDTAEIPFAVDREGTVYTRNTTERATLDNLGIIDALGRGRPIPHLPNWVIAVSWHRESGLRIGVARPVGENLEELKHTAARNFGWGIGVIVLALIGMVPIADHITRDVKLVTEGAERISQGDLTTKVPVRSKGEFGQLALAFNRMADDLSEHQRRLMEQERARREQDVQQRILALEYERKSDELEEARRFQLSMLPKQVPQHHLYDIAVMTQTAAEVGGDYYDFHLSRYGVLSVTIGDATGHGAKAGTMVTVVKTLFAGYTASTDPSTFLGDAAEKIKRMDLGRMAMALSLARFDGKRLTVASAGMPPLLIHRASDGRVDEIVLGATPLGTLGVDYDETDFTIGEGDTVLLMSDGFPELQNADGQQLGYLSATQEFASAAVAPTAEEVIARLADAVKSWHGDQPPNDDITFVVVRCRA